MLMSVTAPDHEVDAAVDDACAIGIVHAQEEDIGPTGVA